MASIHIDYSGDYFSIKPIIDQAREEFDSVVVRDLYDHWDYGTLSFDFKTEEQAMLFKLKYGGRFRPHG